MPETTAAPAALTIWQEIDRVRPQLAGLLPRHVSLERFVHTARVTLAGTAGLISCKRETILQGLMRCAELGLEVAGPLGHAYLLPFGQEATLVIGYKGYIKLILQSARYSHVDPVCVFEGDEFDFERGTSAFIKHKPHVDPADGVLTHAYAVVTDRNGQKKFDVMTKKEIDRIKAMSKQGNNPNGMWVKHYNEAAKKTVIRRLVKTLDQSPELAKANEWDADSPEFEVSGQVVSRKSGVDAVKERLGISPDANAVPEGTSGQAEE